MLTTKSQVINKCLTKLLDAVKKCEVKHSVRLGYVRIRFLTMSEWECYGNRPVPILVGEESVLASSEINLERLSMSHSLTQQAHS